MASPDPIREQPFERALPNSAEAERAILGAVLLDNSLISQAIEQLRAEDFYVPSHRLIFLAMIMLFELGAEAFLFPARQHTTRARHLFRQRKAVGAALRGIYIKRPTAGGTIIRILSGATAAPPTNHTRHRNTWK